MKKDSPEMFNDNGDKMQERIYNVHVHCTIFTNQLTFV
jgi:hypothetical protein